MFREGLAENNAMLFIFDREEQYPFWMKNMKFSVDIIWIDRNKRIVDIKKSVYPCKETCASLIPQAPALYVLEAPAGFAEKKQIKVGNTASFK